MILILFLSFFNANDIPLIPDEYSDIYTDVIKRAKQKSSIVKEIPSMKPGSYDFNGFSFDLSKTLTAENTDLIRALSFSNDNSKAFLYQTKENQLINENSEEIVIADKDSNSFYLLKSIKAKTGPVFMYDSEAIDPLKFIRNIHVAPIESPNYQCSYNASTQFSAVCNAWIGYNWPTPKENINPLDEDPIEKQYFDGNFTTKIGAYAQIIGSFNFSMYGINDISLDYFIEGGGVLGFGAEVQKQIINGKISTAKACLPIYSAHYTIFGIQTNFVFEGCIDGTVSNINLTLPEPIKFYKRKSITFRKEGHVSPSGFSGQPFFSTLQPSDRDVVTSYETFSPVDSYLEANVTLRLYANFKFNLFSSVNGSVAVGIGVGNNWKFEGNPEKCLCPYMYGSFGVDVYGYYSSSPIQINIPSINYNFTILSELYDTYLIYSSPKYNSCIFSPVNSLEGDSDLIIPKETNSIVIRPYKATYNSTSKATFSERIDVYDNNELVKSLQLQSLKFTGEQNTKELSRFLVLNNLSSQAYMVFNGVKVNTLFDDTLQYNQNYSLGADVTQEICSSSGSSTPLCITTEISHIINVEISKEFEYQENRYVSIGLDSKSWTPESQETFSIISHSQSTKYDTYNTQIFDDSSLDSKYTQSTFYTTRETIDLSLDKLFFSCGWTSSSPYQISLWFYNCESDDSDVSDESKCLPIGQMLSSSAYRLVENTPDSMHIVYTTLPFICSNNSVLKVTLRVNTLLETAVEFIFDTFHGTQTSSLDNGDYNLTLSFSTHYPTLLFNTTKLTSDIRGIVARVFPVNSSKKMDDNERYGFIKLDVSSNENKNSYVIIRTSETSISIIDDSVTTLEDNVYLIKIPSSGLLPFRRSTSQSKDVLFTQISTFSNSDDPYCELSAPKYEANLGCIDMSGSRFHYSVESKYEFEAVKELNNEAWSLYKFTSKECPPDEIVHISNTYFDLTKQPILTISNEFSQQFVNSSLKFKVNCSPNCETALWETYKFTHYGEELNDIENKTYTVTSICKNKNSKYCMYHDKLGDHSGIYLVSGDAQIDNNPRGFTLQIAYQDSTIIKFGEVKISSLLTGPLNFDKTSVDGGDYTIISAKIGFTTVPISISFIHSPEKVLDALGCEKPNEGYSPGDATMFSNGSIKVRTSLLVRNPSRDCVDVPDSYIISNTVMIIIYVSVSITSILIIIGIIFTVFWCKKNRRLKHLDMNPDNKDVEQIILNPENRSQLNESII